MTTVTLTSTESRHVKALALLAQRGQWLTVKGRNGALYVGIPSQTKRGLVHLVATDGSRCDCYDFRNSGRGGCKHTLARKLDLIACGAEPQPQPASDTVDGLRQMLDERLAAEKPVLEMVREPEGDVTWRALADKYDDIFTRFDDDPKPLTRDAHPELARILGKPRRGVIPAAEIEREA